MYPFVLSDILKHKCVVTFPKSYIKHVILTIKLFFNKDAILTLFFIFEAIIEAKYILIIVVQFLIIVPQHVCFQHIIYTRFLK